jgi:lipopolysaccharide/colanic/teichoic acid biosynthesis glycosyltransferase
VVCTAGSSLNLGDFEPAPPVTSPVRFLMIGRMLEDKGSREFRRPGAGGGTVRHAQSQRDDHAGPRYRRRGALDERGDDGVRRRVWKRALDLVIAVPVAIVAAPVMLAIALAVRLDSPGPVLFTQVRLGRDRRPFTILKVRTMLHRDARAIDQLREGVVAEGHDPRITRVGRYLRATSLDELPQVWNVLRGDTSLVGPRSVLPSSCAPSRNDCWGGSTWRRA